MIACVTGCARLAAPSPMGCRASSVVDVLSTRACSRRSRGSETQSRRQGRRRWVGIIGNGIEIEIDSDADSDAGPEVHFLVMELENRIDQLGADNIAAFFAEPVILDGHSMDVFTIAFSPDGTRFATGGNDPGIQDLIIEIQKQLKK